MAKQTKKAKFAKDVRCVGAVMADGTKIDGQITNVIEGIAPKYIVEWLDPLYGTLTTSLKTEPEIELLNDPA